MVFLEWTSLAPSSGRKAGIALLLLAVAALVNAVLRWRVPSSDVQLAMSMLALVGWWMAAFAICFGSRAFRRVLFPLCFLLWMVPLPQFALNWIVSLLQQGSAAAAHALFVVAGVPVAQQGLLVHIPGLTLEVAPECSSIRSSLMLLVTTMVLAHLLLRSFWRKALLVAVAIPVSVRQERTSDICPRNAWKPCRSQFPDGKTPPRGWDHLFHSRIVRDGSTAVGFAPWRSRIPRELRFEVLWKR